MVPSWTPDSPGLPIVATCPASLSHIKTSAKKIPHT